MPKKSSPVLEKVSRLMKIPILTHKLKNPPSNCLNLMFFIKSRQIRKSLKLLRPENYEFVHEYEYSVSSTPLIGYERGKKTKNRDLCSILFVFNCLGIAKEEPRIDNNCSIEGLARFDELEDATMLNRGEEEVETMSDSSSSVDERAEKFIQMFYQQMRMQRLESS